jgi:Family of unknown function (DUF6368)
VGPTVAIWLTPRSGKPAPDLLRIARRLDPGAESATDFQVASTVRIGGATCLVEPRPIGLAHGDAGRDDFDLRTAAALVGFHPERAVHAFAYCNDAVDHRVLGELALFLARELGGLIDFGASLGEIHAPQGTLFTITYGASTLNEVFHVSDARFLEWWLTQRDFRMVK